jgi:hypothetical protein
MKKFLLCLLISNYSFVFTLNSTSSSNFRGWNTSEIQFAVNSTNCPTGIDISSLLEDSFKVWHSVATSNLKLKVIGTTTSTTFSNPVTVYCESNFSPIGDINYVPAAASVTTQGDYAVGGLIYLNVSSGRANIANFNSNSLKITLAHEVGHILGLGHSHDRSALMYYDGSYYINMSLGQDDVDGITYLYPRNEISKDKPLGCALLKNINSNNNSNSSPFNLIIMLLPLLLYLILKLQTRKENLGNI